LRKSSEIATGRVANPKVYALPADLEASMDALLASDERDAVVETLFRELESMSEEDLSALRSAPLLARTCRGRPYDHSRAAC
jgi:hypothetical protein